jgi:TatA/E family protein of Tat protein translocase
MSYFPSVAFLGGSVGASEWVVLFVVVLVVVGPKRLPEVARKLGRTMEMFRRAADEFKDQLMNMDQVPPAGNPNPPPDASSSSASPDSPEAYENPYPDASDYPGNEGQVENWSPASPSEGAGGEAPTETAGEEKPAEGGQ